MEQTRFKSPVLKTGLVALFIFALKEFTGYELESELAETFIKVVFIIVTAFAEINNPKDSENF